MARTETLLRDLALDEPSIVALTGDRVLDRDYRTDGWENAPVVVKDDDDVMLTTLVFTQYDGLRPVGSPLGAHRKFLMAWAFSSNSIEGFEDVERLLALVRALLSRNFGQLPDGSMVTWTGLLGPFSDDNGVVYRHDYAVSGIPANALGERW